MPCLRGEQLRAPNELTVGDPYLDCGQAKFLLSLVVGEERRQVAHEAQDAGTDRKLTRRDLDEYSLISLARVKVHSYAVTHRLGKLPLQRDQSFAGPRRTSRYLGEGAEEERGAIAGVGSKGVGNQDASGGRPASQPRPSPPRSRERRARSGGWRRALAPSAGIRRRAYWVSLSARPACSAGAREHGRGTWRVRNPWSPPRWLVRQFYWSPASGEILKTRPWAGPARSPRSELALRTYSRRRRRDRDTDTVNIQPRSSAITSHDSTIPRPAYTNGGHRSTRGQIAFASLAGHRPLLGDLIQNQAPRLTEWLKMRHSDGTMWMRSRLPWIKPFAYRRHRAHPGRALVAFMRTFITRGIRD